MKQNFWKSMSIIFLAVAVSFGSSCGNKEENYPESKYKNMYQETQATEIMTEGVTWPEGQALPTFAPIAGKLDVIDVSTRSANVQTMLVTLQGIVNRKTPRIFLWHGSDDLEKWPEEFGFEYEITKNEKDIVEKYKSEIKGLIVWDRRNDYTLNLATTLAGLNDAMVVTKKQAETYTAEPFNFPIIENLCGVFEDKYEMYEYMYENVWPECTKRTIVSLDPSESQHFCHLRDMAVAVKAAVLWLDPTQDRDKELLKKFLGDCDYTNCYITGWWPDEGEGVTLGCNFGIPTIPSDYFVNYTVYSSMSRELEIKETPKKPELENKIYIAFIISDGDNIQYIQHFMKRDTMSWLSEDRGKIPLSWTVSPAIYDAAPQILNYYYKTATDNDLLICGPSGLGYGYLQLFSDLENGADVFGHYVKMSDNYFWKTGLNFVTLWHELTKEQEDILGNNWRSLLALSTYRPQLGKEDSGTIGSAVKFRNIPAYAHSTDEIYNEIKSEMDKFDGSRPVFLCPQAVAWDISVTDLVEFSDKLKAEYGDTVEFVRADHLAMLYAEYSGVNYNISLRCDSVTASGEDEGFEASNAVDGSFSKNNGWKSSKEGDKWLTVDLKEEYRISRYVLKNAQTGYYDAGLNTKAFKIQASTDGENWTDIDWEYENTSSIIDKDVERFIARYIRVYIIDPGADGVARIQELEIYGKRAG